MKDVSNDTYKELRLTWAVLLR